MAKPGSTSSGEFGPLSKEVMDAVWAAGKAVSVREIVDMLNGRRLEPLAYTTVMTVMNRLAEKQTLERRRSGQRYLYEPTAPDPAGLAVRNVIRVYGDAAVSHFVDEAREDPVMLQRLRRLLADEP